jgi:hypothetical protein
MTEPTPAAAPAPADRNAALPDEVRSADLEAFRLEREPLEHRSKGVHTR